MFLNRNNVKNKVSGKEFTMFFNIHMQMDKNPKSNER